MKLDELGRPAPFAKEFSLFKLFIKYGYRFGDPRRFQMPWVYKYIWNKSMLPNHSTLRDQLQREVVNLRQFCLKAGLSLDIADDWSFSL